MVIKLSRARPKDFDLAQYWRSSTKAFIESLPNYEVLVEVLPAILPRLKFMNRLLQMEDGENQEEWLRVKLSFHTENEAKGFILGFTDQIKVIEPKELHEKLLQMAEEAVKFYKQREC
ncbi:hypothetical protein CEW92_16680 [Bacillaceae bacterium SAS-127]|nr:hypothetical protein CEW92_16680 [Bacillaceae bacterium SAS-127]